MNTLTLGSENSGVVNVVGWFLGQLIRMFDYSQIDWKLYENIPSIRDLVYKMKKHQVAQEELQRLKDEVNT